MSWKGDLLKAGISSDGVDIEFFKGLLNTLTGIKCDADDSNAEGLKILAHQVSLIDDAVYNLPDATDGFALVLGGTEGGIASVAADGTCTVLAGTSNFVGTDSDTDLCIFDAGTNARIRNRTGGTLTIRFVYLYF